MTQPATMRLLIDPPLDGPTNMARDEALLERVGTGDSLPTLRLYQWNRPTISLGYFQRYADYESLPPPAGELAVVRRQTGGGAILHDLELTYSLTLSAAHPLLAGGANRLYERAHDAIVACLSDLKIEAGRCGTSDDSGAAKGPFFCFARRHCYDLLIGEDKVAGSAQRRTRHAVLQHGSIVLANRFPQQPSAFISDDATRVNGHATPSTPDWFAPRLTAARETLPNHFARVLGASMLESAWRADELSSADRLTEKYAGDEWTKRT